MSGAPWGTRDVAGRAATRPTGITLGLVRGLTSASAALLAAVASLYILRPEWGVAVTVSPLAVWVLIGVVALVPCMVTSVRRRAIAVMAGWLLLAVLACEEPRAIMHVAREWPEESWEQARPSGRALRIITMNCAGGDERAASDAMGYEPDILLLQEAPGDAETAAVLASVAGYEAARGLDCTIIARGEVRAWERDPRLLRTTGADVRVEGHSIAAISTHIELPWTRIDVYRSAAWRAAAAAQASRREEMSALADLAIGAPRDVPLVLGGDLNTPAGDRLLRLLPRYLHDAFEEAGTGWPNTIVSDMPISRIDYIYVSDHFEVRRSVARYTPHSDHRMVIADVVLRE